MRNERGSQYESKAREAWATPVKIVQYNCTCGKTMKFVSENGVIAPQRSESSGKPSAWVGLTDEEAQWLYDNCRTPSNLIDMVEAKLKERNS
jgi:hypothetical protein